MDGTTPGRSRGFIGAVAVTALLLVVAAVAPTPLEGGMGLDISPRELQARFVPVARFLFLALMTLAFYQWLVGRDLAPGRRQGRRGGPATLAIVFGLLLALFAFLLYSDSDGFNLLFGSEGDPDQPPPELEAGDPIEGPTFDPGAVEGGPFGEGLPGPELAWLLGLALAGGLVAAFLRTRSPAGKYPPVAPPTPTDPPLAIEPQPVAGDPRSRVLAAYRGVERAAEPHLPRSPWETVSAHLDRLPPAGGAAARLAWVYNLARYSRRHIVDEDAAEAESAAAALKREID